VSKGSPQRNALLNCGNVKLENPTMSIFVRLKAAMCQLVVDFQTAVTVCW